jgi:PrtD family type I secretion system ABC transporter
MITPAKQKSLLAASLAASPKAALHMILLSGVVNVVMLTSPLFMMQVYDRVLASRSLPTLVSLCLIAVLAYAAIWLLDLLRGRIVALFAERIADEILPAAKRAAVELQVRQRRSLGDSELLFRDIETVRSFGQTPAPLAFLDLPWLPIYMAVAFMLHPLIGWSVVAGIAILAVITWLGEQLSNAPAAASVQAHLGRQNVLQGIQSNAEAIRAMGMEQALWSRWERLNAAAVSAQNRVSSIAGALGGLSRTFRQVFQSGVLAIGAMLVILGEMSGGAIIAATILAGRALAPIDQAIAQWRPLLQARDSLQRLERLLRALPPQVAAMALPLPSRSVELRDVSIAVPGHVAPVIQGVTLTLQAGEALGVIGSSASGKTTLARAVVGIWQPVRGRIMLDGADLGQFDASRLGSAIGFMPQDVQLLDGTIGQNIARFGADATPDQIIAAAKAASFHQHALAFPNGYDTPIGPNGAHLSAGQRQRIGLARALFGNPFLVVLDEPNANLDAEGETAVARAVRGIRNRGGVAIIIAHRPSAISQATHLLVMEGGQMAAYGPKREVIAHLNGSVKTDPALPIPLRTGA